MSELKIHKIGDLCFDFKMGKDVGIDFYLKSEADAAIAKLNAENERLKKCEIWMKQHFYCEEVIACESAKKPQAETCVVACESE